MKLPGLFPSGAFPFPGRRVSSVAPAALALVLLVLWTPGVRAQAAPPLPAPMASGPAREFTDQLGRRVTLPAEVRRIVSLAPNLTETIYALGADQRLVGVTDYCDYPPEAQTKPRVGGAVNPSLEQIVKQSPELVLAQAYGLNRRETVDALERLGIPVYATHARTVDGMIESTRRVAEIVGEAARGEELASALRARLAALERRLRGLRPRRVLFVVWHEPLVTIGRETFIADALRRAGASSVVDLDEDWPRLNLEELVRLQPEYLVFAASHSEGVARTFDTLRRRRGWRRLEAVRRRRVAVISDAVNRPAPRLVDAIEQLARQLHPEAFAEKIETRNSKLEIRPSWIGVPATSSGPFAEFRFSRFEFRFGDLPCSR